jgi:Zn-dependent peptidase ImmA (M78 family)
MHREAQERHPILEREADAFAAEFLLPSETMAGILDQSLNLTFAARLKLTWGVSMQAVVRRARDIGSISERRYRYLFEQIGKLGWRKREPANLDIPVEQPRTFKSMIEFVYEPLREAEQLATEASISHSRAQAILAQYSKALESTPDLEGNQYYNYSGRQGNLN